MTRFGVVLPHSASEVPHSLRLGVHYKRQKPLPASVLGLSEDG